MATATVYQIEGEGMNLLAQLTAELVKQGVGFKANVVSPQRESWIVVFTGAF